MDLEGQVYSVTYTRLPNAGVELILATAEHGELLRVGFTREDAVANVLAFAEATGGLVVGQQL